MKHRSASRLGFTIVELAIVLTVIGLIIGGVLVGRNLIRSYQLQSVLVGVENTIRATQQFKEKYKSLPGDMTNATGIWGADAGCPATAANSVLKVATCNGNGDSRVDMWSAGYPNQEAFRFWQHLAAAAFLPGAFTGAAGGAGVTDAIIGNNVPASRLDGSGLSLWYMGYQSTANQFTGDYGHAIVFGAQVTGNFTIGPILPPTEALALDVKADDGKPAYGNVRTYKSPVNGACTTTDVETTAAYATTDSLLCSMIFFTGL